MLGVLHDTIVASIVIPFEEKDGSVTELFCRPMAFRLNELRRDGKNCFPNKKKISSIRFLDGLNAWSTHTIVASIVIPFEEKMAL